MDSCEWGKIKTRVDNIEREIAEMKDAHKLLESRVWMIVVGGQLLTIIVTILTAVLK